MSHSCIKGEIKKFTNCQILKILRQMWRFQKTKFCASWNIQCRSIMSHIHPPKALFTQIFMILHQCHFMRAIYLSKLIFKMTTFTVHVFCLMQNMMKNLFYILLFSFIFYPWAIAPHAYPRLYVGYLIKFWRTFLQKLFAIFSEDRFIAVTV
jgi:hypothetical protein